MTKRDDYPNIACHGNQKWPWPIMDQDCWYDLEEGTDYAKGTPAVNIQTAAYSWAKARGLQANTKRTVRGYLVMFSERKPERIDWY